MPGVAIMLALAGCGPNEYQDSNALTYTNNSGMIDDGGETPSANQNYAGEVGTILFVASPGGGKPPRLISRTNSITSAPTAKFLAREALAAQQRAPTISNRLIPPLMIAAEDDVDRPILLPTASSNTPGSSTTRTAATPQAGAAQAGTDAPSTANPTILKIIKAP